MRARVSSELILHTGLGSRERALGMRPVPCAERSSSSLNPGLERDSEQEHPRGRSEETFSWHEGKSAWCLEVCLVGELKGRFSDKSHNLIEVIEKSQTPSAAWFTVVT